MLTIRLFCAAGMSTSLLIKKMRKTAEEKGIDVDIEAYPEADMQEKINGIDVALLGPQIAYKLKNFEGVCNPKNIPVGVIPMADYGMMNGEKVLEFAMNLAK